MALKGIKDTTIALSKINDAILLNTDGTKRIADMANSISDLTKEQALLALSTARVSEQDAKAAMVKAGLITAEEADTTATTANTAAKTANLSVTNLLKVAWNKLTAAMYANPFIAVAGTIIAVTAAVIGVTKWFENAGNRAKEAALKSKEALDQVNSEIDQINSSLQTTQNRIDELNAKENLSLIESEELEKLKESNAELERELRIKQALAKREGEKANDKAVKYFNTKTNQVEYSVGPGGMYVSDPTNYSLIDAVEKKLSKIPEMKKSLKELQIQLEELEDTDPNYKNNSDWLNLNGEITKAQIKLDEYLKFVDESISDFMEADDSLVEGMDDGILKRLDSIYATYDEVINGVAQSHTNIISGILEKADFKDFNDQLLKMGKSGSLSVETIVSKFPSLIECLDNAGISAQELYQYIMALANPDAMKFDELKHQLQKVMGFGDGIHTVWAVDKDKQLQDLGLYENDALEVFATIKAKYVNGETETWTPEDWIANIQEGLNSSSELTPSFKDVFSLKDAENNATALSNLSDQLSEVEDAYNTCLAAKEEYDEQGYLSIDTLQKVLSLGDEYLQYLFDEEGNVRLDTDAFKQLAQARINEMEARALNNLAENIKQITNEAAATEYLAQKQNELAGSYVNVAANALLALRSVDGFADSRALQGAYNSFKTQYEQIKSLFASTRKGLDKTYNGISESAKSKAAKAAEDATKKTKDYIDSYMKYMEASLDSGRIDYQTYCREVSAMLKKMYDDGKISAKDFHDYTKQQLEVQKGAMDSVISAVTNRLGKEIDAYKDQQEEVEERYQTEIDYLDTVIKYYEDQKTALQDTNDEKERQLALEQALWNFQRAQTQRTLKVNYMPSYYSNVVCKK